MKIALCISGLMDGFEDSFPFLKENLIDTLKPYIFIHTWDIVGERSLEKIAKTKITEETKNKILKMYHPNEVFFEPFFTFDNSTYKRKAQSNIANTFAMFYKIKKCNDLKSAYEKAHNFTYDVVIRCRFDMRLETSILTDDLHELEEWIYIPEGGDWGGINDQFAFSSSKNMDIYSSLFNFLDVHWYRGCPLHPETLLQYHLENNYLPHRRIYLRYRLAGSARRFVKDTHIKKESAWRQTKIWLICLDEIKLPLIKILDKTILVFLIFISLRRHVDANEQLIFLATYPNSKDSMIVFANKLLNIWEIVGLSERNNRYKLLFCNPEEINEEIGNIRKYSKKMDIPLLLMNHLGRADIIFQLFPFVLFVIYRIVRKCYIISTRIVRIHVIRDK